MGSIQSATKAGSNKEAAEAEARRKREEEARRKAEAARKEAARKAAEEAAKKKAEAEAARKAAAKRIAEAYEKHGDAKAAETLRTEMAKAKAEDRAAILKEAKATVDQIAKDIGKNSRRGEKDWERDWKKDGAKADSYSTDANNKDPIDTKKEYQYSLQDMAASLQMAGDKDAAFHVASTILKEMPASKDANTQKNLLGLFGDGVTAASADKFPLLQNAAALTLLDSRQKGPNGTELARNMEQRTEAARTLDPSIDNNLTIQIEDWTDEKGVKNDGHLWHEVSQNPDLFLTGAQRKSIRDDNKGLSEAKIQEIKIDQAKLNVMAQHEGRDLNHVKDGEELEYKHPDRDPGLDLDPAVKEAMDRSKTDHQGDTPFSKHLDRFAGTDRFGKLSVEEQIGAIHGYDRVTTQSDRSGKPLAVDQREKLETLLTSKQHHKLDGQAQRRVETMFGEFVDVSPSRIDGLMKIVDKSGLSDLGNPRHQMQILEGFQNDKIIAATVDKLADKTGLSGEHRKNALLAIRSVYVGNLYDHDREVRGDDGRKKLMENVFMAATSPEFGKFNEKQRTAMVAYLAKLGGHREGDQVGVRHLGLNDGGYKKAIEMAVELAPKTDKTFESNPPTIDGFQSLLVGNTTGAGKTPQPSASGGEPSKSADPAKNAAPADATDGAGKTQSAQSATQVSDKDKASDTPVTKEKVKDDLKAAVDNADEFAADDKTVNDSLRRDAKTDPVEFAYKQLAAKHAKDKDYLEKLNGQIDDYRQDYTTKEVKKQFESGDVNGALKTLNSQMEATVSPERRQAMFDAAGKQYFTKEFIRGKLDDALKDRGDGIGKATELAKAYGENAPAEVAGIVTDVFIEELKKPRSQLHQIPTGGAMPNYVQGREFFEGVSALVERADQHGAGRAKDVAVVLKDNVLPGEVIKDEYGKDAVRVDPGVSFGVEEAVGSGNASLSIALINAYSKDSKVMNAKEALTNNGQPGADWAAKLFRDRMISNLDKGLDKFGSNSKGVVEKWQTENNHALSLMSNYGRADPKKALQVIAEDRLANPGDEPNGATRIDNKMEDVYKQGVKAYSLTQQLQELDLDLGDKNASEEVKDLGKSIEKFTDPKNGDVQFCMQPGLAASDSVSLNPELQKYFDAQITFGVAKEQRNSPLQGVYAEQDKLTKWLDKNEDRLPRPVVEKIRDQTDIWVTEVEDIMVDPPKDAAEKIRTATDEFEKKLSEHLKGQPVQPDNSPTEVKNRVLKDIEAIQKTGVMLRLGLNAVQSTGNGLMFAYAKRKTGLMLAGRHVDTGSMGGRTAQRIARLTFADPALVERSVERINAFQATAIAERAAHNGTTPSKARTRELMNEFWLTHPNPNRKVVVNGPNGREIRFDKGFDSGVGTAGTWAKNSGHVLRIAAFGVGAPVLQESANKEQDKKAGYQLSSDQLYAMAFTTGAITESYKLLTGNDLGPQEVRATGSTPARFTGLGWDWTRQLSNGGPGMFLSVADAVWMVEDYKADGKDMNRIGTTLLVTGDVVEIGAGMVPLIRRRGEAALAGAALETIATRASMGWIPVVGWIGSALVVIGQGVRYATGITYDKNKMEYEDNERYRKMVLDMTGLTDDQAKEWMNQSGGPVPQFWKGGVAPTHLLHAVFDRNKVPEPARLDYMRSLSPSEIKKLVEKCHEIEDDEMHESGSFDNVDLDGMREWMVENGYWKRSYLGKAA
jgi:hypothetical protein